MIAEDFGDHFSDYFDVRFAHTEELMRQIHRLRYDVYCREFGFEREEDCPGGLERDAYDDHAVHCLIVHRDSGMGAGCIRVVVPPESTPNFQLPMERFCGFSLTDPILHPARRPRTRVAEVSRLAVHTQFRRRAGESQSPIGRAQDLGSDQVKSLFLNRISPKNRVYSWLIGVFSGAKTVL